MTYRDRREARADRLREWADKRDDKSDAAAQTAHDMASVIPFGQPILVGHHSEGRDRRYRARIASNMDKAVEHNRKAENMRGRADGIERQLDESIYDDDPDAIERLEERIELLEAERERIKKYNASCRKGTPDTSLLTAKEKDDLANPRLAFAWGKGGAFPGYKLTNLGGNIKRNKDRLVVLRRKLDRAAAADQAEGGVLVEHLAHGICRVTFAEKPDRSVITALKDASFRWGKGSWIGSSDSLPDGIQ